MNRSLSLVVLVVVPTILGSTSCHAMAEDKGGDLPIAKEKWDLSPILMRDPDPRIAGTGWQATVDKLEFDGKNEVTWTLRFAADADAGNVFLFKRNLTSKVYSFHFYKEKESVKSTNAYTLKGDVTGKKGDTVRLILELPDDVDFKQITEVKVLVAR